MIVKKFVPQRIPGVQDYELIAIAKIHHIVISDTFATRYLCISVHVHAYLFIVILYTYKYTIHIRIHTYAYIHVCVCVHNDGILHWP